MYNQSQKFDFKPLTGKQKVLINKEIFSNIASDLCGVDRQILCEYQSNRYVRATKL